MSQVDRAWTSRLSHDPSRPACSRCGTHWACRLTPHFPTPDWHKAQRLLRNSETSRPPSSADPAISFRARAAGADSGRGAVNQHGGKVAERHDALLFIIDIIIIHDT